MSLIVKSNDLVQAKYSLTKNEQRLVLYAVSKIQPEDKEFRRYEMTLSEMVELTGISKSRVYEEALAMVRELMKKPITFLTGERQAMVCNWFSSIMVDELAGLASFSVAPELRPYLLQLKKCFTSYRMECVTGFQSRHAFRIYELAKQFESTGIRIFTIEEFRLSLDISDKYKDTYALKKKVIIPALADINAHSDLTVDVEYKKRRQAIEKIIFHIKAKDTESKVNGKPKSTKAQVTEVQVVQPVQEQPLEKPRSQVAKARARRISWESLTEEERAAYRNFGHFVAEEISKGR